MANRLNYSINDILENAARGYNKVPRTSKITPIVRMGVPVRSVQSQMAEAIKEPTSDIGYVKGGDIATGIANALKSGLAVYGAFKDRDAQQAYNDNLAQIAEQERQDKLAQQAAEQDYKDRALAQQEKLAQKQLDAQEARAALARKQALADRAAQYEHEQALYERNREAALADKIAERQYQENMDIEKARRDKLKSELDAQQFVSLLENPQQDIVANNVGWFGKILGKPKYRLSVSKVIKPKYNSQEEDILNRGLK